MAAATARSFRPTGKIEAVRVLVLGANLWAIALLFPALHAGVLHSASTFFGALPLVPLFVGAWALGTLRKFITVSMLIVLFPISLATSLAARNDIAEFDTRVQLFAAALSLLAYGAIALEACARPSELRACHTQALPTAAPESEPRAHDWTRRVLLWGAVLGGLWVSVWAPAQSSRAELVLTWNEAADEAAVFASILGAIASAAAIAGIIGPHLRAPRPSETPSVTRKRTRVVMSLLLAFLSLSGYVVLRAFELRT